MTHEAFRWLGGVIAAHPDRTVVGRTRLQKTMKLLQRLKLPTDYLYVTHFYGPYSEDVQSDVRLLEHLGLITEEQIVNDASPSYLLKATDEAEIPEIEQFRHFINTMSLSDSVVLELAATYDAFRERGASHALALERLSEKKGAKLSDGREARALALLHNLGLPSK